MKLNSILLSGLIFALLVSVAAASGISEGIHGMPWAASASDYQHLTKMREGNEVTYFVNANTLYQVANQSVPGVVYGFYQDQLFAVYIKLRSPDQFYVTAKGFTARYGNPKVTFVAESQQTVYRWKRTDVKIKLKRNESGRDLKLGIYYTPLSDRLNQILLEQFPQVTGQPATGDEASVQKAPLLE